MNTNSQPPITVGFVGLGAIGFGIACRLVKDSHYLIRAYDARVPNADKFTGRGGHIGTSPRDVARDSCFFICMATSETEVYDVLFHDNTGAFEGK